MDTVWINTINSIIICAIMIANSWAIAIFNKIAGKKNVNKEQTVNKEKLIIIKTIDKVLPFFFIALSPFSFPR